MHVDPYAAPRAHVVASEASLPPLLEPIPWSIGEVYVDAWRRFRPHALTIVTAIVLAYALPDLVGFLVGAALGLAGRWFGGPAFTAVQVVVHVGVMLLSVYFQLGALRLALDVAHGETPRVGTIFSGRRYLPFLGQLVLVAIASTIGLLALVLPGIVVSFAFAFAGYFVVDRRLGVLDAMSASWQATRGQRMKLVGLWLASALVVASGLLLLGVGALVTVPLATIAWAVVYARISGSRVPEPYEIVPAELPAALPAVPA